MAKGKSIFNSLSHSKTILNNIERAALNNLEQS